MSDQPKKSNFFEKLATFIVDKRNLIFFLYAIAIIASLITQGWVSGLRRSDPVSARDNGDPAGPDADGGGDEDLSPPPGCIAVSM